MTRIEALRSAINALAERANTLRATLQEYATRDGDPTDEERTQFQADLDEFNAAGPELERMRGELAQLEAIATAPEQARETVPPPTIITLDEVDPSTRGTEFGQPTQVRTLALKAIERAEGLEPEHRASAERVLRGADMPDGRLARHIVTTSRDAYLSAFRKVMARAENLMTDEERQAVLDVRMNSLTDAAGGYAIPFTLDPTVIDTGSHLGVGHMWRQMADTITITTNEWNGLSSSGLSARMTGEAVEAIDASPTLEQPSIPVRKAEAFVVYTEEIYADWPAYDGEIRRMFGIAKDELEDLQFTLGSGTGNNVEGIVTGLVAASTPIVESAAANDFTGPDLAAMENALLKRYRANARWLSSKVIYNEIRAFDTAGGSPYWWAPIGAGLPPTILGYPIEELDNLDSTYGSGENYVAIFGDIRQTYKIVDRVGATVRNYDDLRGTTNGYPNGTGGLRMVWRFGAGVINPAAAKILNVT